MTWPRRRLLAAAAGIGLGAGCIGDDDAATEDEPPEGVPDRIHRFLRNARGYEGSIADERGQDRVDVDVGVGRGGLAFEPAAIRVDVGTTVVWTWTGDGGLHDVVSVGGSDFSFASDRLRDAGETYERTFDDGGVALYECRPHRAQGMLGAVEVMFPDDVVHVDDE